MTEHEQTPEGAIARVGDLAAAAADLAAQPGTAVVPSGTAQAEAVKAGMVEQRAALLHQKQAVEAAAAEAKALVEAKVKEMQRQLQDQLALLEPAMKQLAILSDGVDALNIYLGRDEEIIPLVEGDRAPEGTVITVRQLVLAMDEESLLMTDRDGMDFHDVDKFADWISRDPSHLDQLLPEPKGITAVIPRRARKDYGDPWTQQQADAENGRTFWLIRNGQNAWLTTTQFTVGKHTVPEPREFTDLFIEKGRFGEPDRPLVPGSPAWVKAEETSDRRTRHYMKVALLLQGLLDRTAILHPHAGVSFLDQSHYDQGLVKVILDGENALTDGRLPFREWRQERVKAMHAGMRVIGAFATKMRQFSTRDAPADVRPQGATPANNVPYNVRASTRAYIDWEFVFERHEEIWDEETWTRRLPKTKGTGYLSNNDKWWLPLDTITEDEIRYYMNSRTNRHEYIDMIPVLQVALAVKVAEREAEAPFRAALVDALGREAGLEGTDELAGELIHWYKTANQHHRALTADDAKASRLILTEARRRARGDSKDADQVAKLRGLHPDAMVIARRSADFVVAVPERREYPAEDATIFARLHFYTPAGKHTETREWVAITRAQTARWTVLHETATWAGWTFNPDMQQHYRDDELTAVVDHVRNLHEDAFLIRVEPATSLLSAYGAVFAWNQDDGLRRGRFYVSRDKGGVAVNFTYRTLVEETSIRSEPYWETNWGGEPHPAHDLWRNPDILTKAYAQWADQNARAKLARDSRDRAIKIANLLERAWEVQAEEQVKARFVEDFGDISLWEGHRKTIKLPTYPFRWRDAGDKAFREALTELYVAEPDFDATGMTVAEILDATQTGHAGTDETLLHLIPVPREG
ncbi:hypothetical protein [Microbacterium sp. 77mftsu3.1]|uniref:hypothetical protein n=1 Tax=Microbacterium sp. 77mftsu3.1 TaxID=1761802 RepID=UPI00036E2AF5|nr:hypothetical protein [Microbacterium sp. 77mftsu3.1]SDH32350.1 hypothetical protein SAMN04488590_3026 [Microbacterium sp. 77mftsu3.1]